MGSKLDYETFLIDLDKKLKYYYEIQKQNIKCCVCCSACCEEGDYPLSDVELKHLMKGFLSLDFETRKIVQVNIKNMVKGGVCPFLIDKKCSVYDYRPIVCRVHGLAFTGSDGVVVVPFCANNGKNYADKYKNKILNIEPIKENLNTHALLNNVEYGEIRYLYDWYNYSK